MEEPPAGSPFSDLFTLVKLLQSQNKLVEGPRVVAGIKCADYFARLGYVPCSNVPYSTVTDALGYLGLKDSM